VVHSTGSSARRQNCRSTRLLAYQLFLSLFPFAILVAAFSGALVQNLGLPDVVELLFRLLKQLSPAVAALLRADLLAATGAPAPPGELDLWGALTALACAGAAGVYRLAPSATPPWRGMVPGALLFGAGWLLVTVGFSVFVTAFADLGVTYGAPAGAVALLMSLYWTAYLLLAGAVLNAVLGEGAGLRPAPVRDSPDGAGTRGSVH
jgi:uncharacterized BrkB/YihY/UPF0761 family membrane protein